MTTPSASAVSGRAWFAVFLLTGAHVLSFVDRQVLNLMVGPIRADLGISDTQMSLLMGFSFALFYTVCGYPLAWQADRGSRRLLIAAGALAWSVATAACGLAQRYGQLLAARIGVGIGEASLSPAAFSLIADSFPSGRRATAIGLFSTGVHIGSGLAFLLGGLVIHYAAAHGAIMFPLLGEVRPWQFVFLLLGGSGALFSLLLLAIHEPARTVQRAAGMPVGDFLRALRERIGMVSTHHVGFALIALATYGSGAWLPSYLIRVHHWTPAEVGVYYGGIVAVAGTVGAFTGGALADFLSRRGWVDATLRVGILGALGAVPFVVVVLTAEARPLILAAMAPAVFCFSMPFGVAAAGLQEVMPASMRAQASAIYLLVLNLVGLGCGPTVVALITDHVFGSDQAVGQSLLIVCTVAPLLAAGVLALGLRPFRAAIERGLAPP